MVPLLSRVVCGTVEAAAVGAQTERPGAAGPVGPLLGGYSPPAASFPEGDSYQFPSLSNTEIVLVLVVTTDRSSRPSPSKSAIASGEPATEGKCWGAWNVPSPLPSHTLLPQRDTMSMCPSLLKSPATTFCAIPATPKPVTSVDVWKVPSPLFRRTLTRY